jgi:hypothetical protein
LRVAAQEQVVKVELRNGLAAAFQLDGAQRADFRDAAADEQSIGDRRQATHGIRARLHGVADDEHLDEAQLAHLHARLRADELLRDALFDRCARSVEAQPAHCDWADLRQVDPAIAPHDQ